MAHSVPTQEKPKPPAPSRLEPPALNDPPQLVGVIAPRNTGGAFRSTTVLSPPTLVTVVLPAADERLSLADEALTRLVFSEAIWAMDLEPETFVFLEDWPCNWPCEASPPLAVLALWLLPEPTTADELSPPLPPTPTAEPP